MAARVRLTLLIAALVAVLPAAGCGATAGDGRDAASAVGAVAASTGAVASASSSGRASSAAHPSPSVRPSAAAPLSGPLALTAVAGKVIVVDPGHNGNDAAHPEIIRKLVPMGTGTKPCETTGTETNAGYQEAAFTFDVATRLAVLLRAAGAKVILTRTTNTGVGPCVNQRAAIGNDNHAAVAVSIHGDGAPAGGHGFHVLEPARVGAPSNVIIGSSHQLALKIRDNYRARTGIPASNYIGKDGINTRADMGGLNLSTVPKVMVECGNMRNAGDAAKMTSPAYRERMAEGLAAGLAAFLAG